MTRAASRSDSAKAAASYWRTCLDMVEIAGDYMREDAPREARELAWTLYNLLTFLLFVACFPVTLPIGAILRRGAARSEVNRYRPGTYRRGWHGFLVPAPPRKASADTEGGADV